MTAGFQDDGHTPESGPHEPTPAPVLSARERQVLIFTSQGKTAAQVAALMFLSQRTVNFHISKAVAKLGAANKTEAVAIAIRAGWI